MHGLHAGTFVRITHKEVSVSDPDAVNQLLLGRLRKVSQRLPAHKHRCSIVPETLKRSWTDTAAG